MSAINRFVVTGDVFRPNQQGNAGQDININWLYAAVQQPLRLATTHPVEKALFSKQPTSLTRSAYSMLEEPISTQAWAKLFHWKQLTQEFLQYVWLVFRKTIVIAFELPEVLRSAFEKLGIIYVDIIVHPVRFLDDVIFGIRSNHPEIAQALYHYVIPEESILLSSGMVLATMARLKPLPIRGKAVLFAGQTTDDKVLIHGDRFFKPSDFVDRFVELAAQYDTVLIKPHPYSREPFDAISISRLIDNCVVVKDNFYYLMAQDNVEAVYSISSSTSIEAQYLGKAGHHFAEYPFAFSDRWSQEDFKAGAFTAVDDVIFSADFWRHILSPVMSTTQASGIRLPKKPNRIRSSLRNFWGFNFVDTDIICDLYKK